MYFTILDIFPLVQGILAVDEVDALSTSIRHRNKEESFYLKIVPVPCCGSQFWGFAGDFLCTS
jgi:hypothetical protein